MISHEPTTLVAAISLNRILELDCNLSRPWDGKFLIFSFLFFCISLFVSCFLVVLLCALINCKNLHMQF